MFMSPTVTAYAALSKVRRETAGDGHKIGRRRYYLYAYTSGEGWVPLALVPSLEFEDGKLYIGGALVLNPKITADHVTWLQQAEDKQGRYYTVGHLHLHSNGFEAHGTVTVGTSHADATTHTVFVTTIPTITYQTKISASLIRRTRQ